MTTEFPFLHFFKSDISVIEKPERFTFPFCYDPHPLSVTAAQELQDYLKTQTDFEHNFGLREDQQGLVIGKMFGVLAVETQQGKLAYLAACSGKLAGSNRHSYFVPPIFDMLDPEGFFLQEEALINQLNREIECLEHNPQIEDLKLRLIDLEEKNKEVLAAMRKLHKENKAKRKAIRNTQKGSLSADAYVRIEEDLMKQSYRDQHEYNLLKISRKEKQEAIQQQLAQLYSEIEEKKNLRKQKSASLQNKLFDQYHFWNAKGEQRSVISIFKEATQLLPPAGAGECAAPKLLQYAYTHQLKPICMAEFWWGASPASEVRRHGYFYPSCRGKCEPILGHMLQGVDVAANPMLDNPAAGKELEVVYEDDDIIVVNKPAEFLSVPGIHVKDSVQTRLLLRNPEITGPVIIHRLDMSTSGLLIVAKHKEAHQFVQDQFIKHTVHKRYTALLDDIITTKKGLIDIPLRVDLDDRPRQVVCYDYGKPAQTKYRVIATDNGKTRIHFFPLTGRTHQLRVHAAHRLGLNTPIVGDDLYGVRADRLHLHAGYIRFVHPRTQREVSFEIADPF